MKIPASGRRRALAIVDVQQPFISSKNQTTVRNIKRLIRSAAYDLYVCCTFSAEAGSIWDKQTGWVLPKSDDTQTIDAVAMELRNRPVIKVQKCTKSIFKGSPSLMAILNERHIEELHLVGFDVNDCVMASAFDSFDNQIYTYVIEECCAASRGTLLWEPAVKILRYVNLTNNSVHEKLRSIHI